DNLEVKIVELIQMKQREEESVKMYMYCFDICAEQVMPLSLTLFDAAKTIAEIMKKYLLEVENKKKIVGIMNDDKEINIFDKTNLANISYEVKIVEHKIKIMSKLEKIKMDK
ncbi:20860_t:CDS:2, partial [Gigaspora margarita]